MQTLERLFDYYARKLMTWKINLSKRFKIILVFSGSIANFKKSSPLNKMSTYMYLKIYCRELIGGPYWPRRVYYSYINAQWDVPVKLNISQLWFLCSEPSNLILDSLDLPLSNFVESMLWVYCPGRQSKIYISWPLNNCILK